MCVYVYEHARARNPGANFGEREKETRLPGHLTRLLLDVVRALMFWLKREA